jgi:hypothetical protein
MRNNINGVSRFQVVISSLPFMYTYLSRLSTLPRFFQFFGGEILPVTSITYLLLNNGSVNAFLSAQFVSFILLSIFAYIIFFTIYEVGYIVNDCVTAKNEFTPSIRFSNTQYWKQLVGAKVFFFITLVITGYFFIGENFLYYFPLAIVVLSTFYLHNRWRVEDRGISYFWLENTRLMMLPLLVITDLTLVLLSFLLITPELLRRTIRYIRIKNSTGQHNFTFFDLQASLMSIGIVSIFLFKFAPNLVAGFLLIYFIIVFGIVISIYKVDKHTN